MKKRPRILLIASAIVVVIAIAAALASYAVQNRAAVTRDQDIFVPTGASYQTLIDSLTANRGVIANMETFKRVASLQGTDKQIRPGRYVLTKGMSYKAAARMFKTGTQKPVRVTFNNIRTLDRLAGSISKQIEPDSLSLYYTMIDDSIMLQYGFTAETFPAMFIPNTYELYWNTSPEKFIERMGKEYERFWNEERTARLEQIGMSREEVATLASIIYEETKMSDEMPTVAGVYLNRLRIGMPLQADPTLKFAAGDFTIRRVLNKHKEIDSPYNTYMYGGLPPGPICVPSIKAIDAVLNPQQHDYLYFCARPDFSGYHNFARTLAQHNRNAAEYSAFLNRNGIMK